MKIRVRELEREEERGEKGRKGKRGEERGREGRGRFNSYSLIRN